jgi:hypothetical protein
MLSVTGNSRGARGDILKYSALSLDNEVRRNFFVKVVIRRHLAAIATGSLQCLRACTESG